MILRGRLLSASRGGTGALAAGAIFVAGLLVGATIAPVIAGRDADGPSSPTALAQPPADGMPMRTAHPSEVLRVIDGDTFEARVHLWPGLDITTRVRLRGIDAPEFKARCAEERERAERAREALRAILQQGEVGIAHVTLDKFGGRVVADASTELTPDVSAALIAAGMARRYAGGRREGWCDRSSL
jgi:endonuclease YncB( thermonuclease family)